MKNAVVFGATGQLGCYSAIALKEDGYNVYAVGRRNSDNGFFETKGITFIGGVDVSDKSTFDRLPKEKIDVVVNMAGTMPAHANRDMMPYVQSIIVGTVNITEWMKTVECQRIIFNTTPSDTAEYWGTTTPIDDDVVRSFPKNGNDHAVYAICKRAATDILEHLQICGEDTLWFMAGIRLQRIFLKEKKECFHGVLWLENVFRVKILKYMEM